MRNPESKATSLAGILEWVIPFLFCLGIYVGLMWLSKEPIEFVSAALLTIIGGILTLALKFWRLSRSFSDFRSRSVAELGEIESITTNAWVNGLLSITPEWSERMDDVYSKISSARRSIRILQTWVPDMASMAPHIVKALKNSNDLRVEILLVNPDSYVGVQRIMDTRRVGDIDKAKVIIESQVKECRDLLMVKLEKERLSADRIEFRFYECLPSVCLIILDYERVLVGFFLRSSYSQFNPRIEFQLTQEGPARSFVDHWERVWESAVRPSL